MTAPRRDPCRSPHKVSSGARSANAVLLGKEGAPHERGREGSTPSTATPPRLLRLKELDSLKEMAAKVHEVRLVVGASAMNGLVPSGFFNETREA